MLTTQKHNASASDPELRFSDVDKRNMRNCERRSNKMFFASWFHPLRRCPKAVISNNSWYLISVWQNFKQYKLLPYLGELFNQPAWVFDAIQSCDAESVKIQNEQTEKTNQDMEAKWPRK